MGKRMIQGSYYVIMESEDMWICVFPIYVLQVQIFFFWYKNRNNYK